MSLTFQRAIVVGASSGIGAEIARQLAATGTTVAILGRRTAELEEVAADIRSTGRGGVIPVTHDVRRTEEVPELFERLVAELGGLDLLVYAAGVMYLPAEGEYDSVRDRETFEVNLLGAMAWTNPAAATFQARRAGTIVGVSSIAGERGRRPFPAYSASKAGLTAWLEALRNRVSRHGVNVVTVKPGIVDTVMSKDLPRKPMMVAVGHAAGLILDAARPGGSPSRFIPARWGVVAFVLRLLPSAVFRRLDL